MGSSFDWATEQDKSWEGPGGEPPPERRSRRWPFVLLLFLLMATGITAVVREVRRRVAVVDDSTSLEVVDSHRFIQNLSTPADTELLINYLSGAVPDWAVAQEALLTTGRFNNYPFYGLYRIEEPFDDEQIVDVTINADLTAAVVIAQHPYHVRVGPTLTRTVTLEQSLVYRKGPNRWLLAPPLPEFWGEEETYVGQHLLASFPARDAVLLRQLLRELDGKLAQLCAQRYIVCPNSLVIHLIFTTDPAPLGPSFRNLSEMPRISALSAGLRLPTPTLFGIPTDVQGYNALLRAYGRPIVAGALADLVRWDCCRLQLFYDGALDLVLADLGLGARRLAAEDYAQLVEDNTDLSSVVNVWRFDNILATASEVTITDAWVEFIADELGWGPPLQVLTAVSRAPEGQLADWLRQEQSSLAAALDDGELDRHWRRYLVRRAAAAVSRPISLPRDPLLVICQPADAEAYDLYRVTPATAAWEHLATYETGRDEFAALFPLPDGQGTLVSLEAALWLWTPAGESTVLLQYDAPTDAVIPVGVNPAGTQVVVYAPNGPGGIFYRLLDLSDCNVGQCAQHDLLGFPIWSSDGEYTVLHRGLEALTPLGLSIGQLWLGDADGKVLADLGLGRLATWVAGNNIGLIGADYSVTMTDVAAVLGDPVAEAAPSRTVYASSQAAAALDIDLGVRAFAIPIGPASAQPSELLLTGSYDVFAGSPSFPEVFHTLAYNLTDDTYRMLFNSAILPFSQALSNDGRWLLVRGVEVAGEGSSVGSPGRLLLFNLATGLTRTEVVESDLAAFTGPTWSKDGNWTVAFAADWPRLIALEPAYSESLIPPHNAPCFAASWLG